MGVPRYVLTDNMKSVVIKRDMDGNPVWNRDYEQFMKLIGFQTRLCKPCLIIDEVGHCVFDPENTRLFFDMIDRRYHLDRIFDDSLIFNFNGESHRGLNREVISLTTKKIKAAPVMEQPELV